jgi:hypothetical protein
MTQQQARGVLLCGTSPCGSSVCGAETPPAAAGSQSQRARHTRPAAAAVAWCGEASMLWSRSAAAVAAECIAAPLPPALPQAPLFYTLHRCHSIADRGTTPAGCCWIEGVSRPGACGDWLVEWHYSHSRSRDSLCGLVLGSEGKLVRAHTCGVGHSGTTATAASRSVQVLPMWPHLGAVLGTGQEVRHLCRSCVLRANVGTAGGCPRRPLCPLCCVLYTLTPGGCNSAPSPLQINTKTMCMCV